MALVLALPPLLIISSDLILRGARLANLPARYLASYALAVAESAVLWGVLLLGASARRGPLRWAAALSFVTLATLAVGTQLYFYQQYSTYLNLDATLFGTSMADSLLGQLRAEGGNVARAILPPLCVAVGLVWLGRKWVRTRRRIASVSAALAPAALGAALLLPCSYRAIQGSTPDVIYFHAIGGLMKQLTGVAERPHVRPKRRTPPALPPLAASTPLVRNVLFVLSESVRADVGCSGHRPTCPVMPFTNEAAPARLPLYEMRASSSTTAIELAVLWSGLPPNAGREPLHSAPLLFDYARAAGIDTAYWTSHHLLFANSRLFVQDLPLSFHCGATTLDPLADIDTGADDRLLTERVRAELPRLREPFFAVVHYGNTHVPYLVDPDDAPFQPALASKAKEDNEAYRNHYKNAVYRQDRTVAELIRFVRGLPLGERTVIFYTSDHGEQFREHGQLGHTGSLYDVEIHVPTWLDAPPAALTAAERRQLAAHAKQPVFHTDVTPTLLELMGLWAAPEVRPFRAKMVGRSLLSSPPGAPTTLALTNCSGVWGCAFENWGVMRGTRKLVAREWDAAWLCYDVAADPLELTPLDGAACDGLRGDAELTFGALPGVR
jgi:glucan phosphoethanolaminetransferase (alkaline phosphatase superfamily)